MLPVACFSEAEHLLLAGRRGVGSTGLAGGASAIWLGAAGYGGTGAAGGRNERRVAGAAKHRSLRCACRAHADAPHTFEHEVRERLEVSREVRGWQYIRAQASQVPLKAAMARVFEHYDFLVSPSVPITATAVDAREVRVGEQDIDVRAALLGHNSAWNLIGLPAISLPVGLVRKMPVGVQVIGAAGENDCLLRVMAQRFVRA